MSTTAAGVPDAVVLATTEDTLELVTVECTVELDIAVNAADLVVTAAAVTRVTTEDTTVFATPSGSSSSELGCVVTSSDDMVTAEGAVEDGDDETRSIVARYVVVLVLGLRKV